MKKGTPKTLLEAIHNGLESSVEKSFYREGESEQEIRAHVVDFLSQKFAPLLLNEKDQEFLVKIKDLFLKIT